jgi:hypothetical protein
MRKEERRKGKREEEGVNDINIAKINRRNFNSVNFCERGNGTLI